MTSLDARVAQGLTFWRALETALHAPDFTLWELEVDGVRSQAHRFVHADGVRFEAPFEVVSRTSVMTLLINGQPLLAREFARPEGEFDSLSWDLCAGAPALSR